MKVLAVIQNLKMGGTQSQFRLVNSYLSRDRELDISEIVGRFPVRRVWKESRDAEVIHAWMASSQAVLCAIVAEIRGIRCVVRVSGSPQLNEFTKGSTGKLSWGGWVKLNLLRIFGAEFVCQTRESAEWLDKQ